MQKIFRPQRPKEGSPKPIMMLSFAGHLDGSSFKSQLESIRIKLSAHGIMSSTSADTTGAGSVELRSTVIAQVVVKHSVRAFLCVTMTAATFPSLSRAKNRPWRRDLRSLVRIEQLILGGNALRYEEQLP
jgi:hypothetical protein